MYPLAVLAKDSVKNPKKREFKYVCAAARGLAATVSPPLVASPVLPPVLRYRLPVGSRR
jgi:hypothetical protein